jgi:hypothetical protein
VGAIVRVNSGGFRERATARRSPRAVLVLATGLCLGLLPMASAPAAVHAEIRSDGPLTRVAVSPDLNCAVEHVLDSVPEFYADTACATLLATGGTLFRPEDIPAGNGAGPFTAFAPLSQSAVTGAGTRRDPLTIETAVAAGDSGLTLTQVDTYVAGDEYYVTTVTVTNSTPATVEATLYRAGDCFLQDSDFGYGSVDEASGTVSCVGVDAETGGPGVRVEQWVPLSAGSSYLQAHFYEVWEQAGAQLPFPNTCRCDELIDNGAGLSWPLSVPAGGTVTHAHVTAFSPDGRPPKPTSLSADPAVASLATDVVGSAVLAPQFSATLTAAAEPVAGQLVRMVVDGTEVCAAMTGADGRATCGDAASLVGVVTVGGYEAVFDGAVQFLPSTGSAGLLTLDGAPVP